MEASYADGSSGLFVRDIKGKQRRLLFKCRLLKRVDSPGEGGGAVTEASESTWDACAH